MFANHRFEIFDHLQRDVIFLVAEIHERARVSAMFGNYDFDRTVWIDMRIFQRGFLAGDKDEQEQDSAKTSEWD